MNLGENLSKDQSLLVSFRLCKFIAIQLLQSPGETTDHLLLVEPPDINFFAGDGN